MYYGEEGESETVALVCEPDHPRAVVDDSSAELDWPRWDAAWKAIESLDELCRPLNNCPPEPDTHLTLRDADGKARLDCPCALDEVSKALLDAAVDAGLQPDQTP